MRGRSKYIGSSSRKDLWPYERWPLLRVAPKRGICVLCTIGEELLNSRPTLTSLNLPEAQAPNIADPSRTDSDSSGSSIGRPGIK